MEDNERLVFPPDRRQAAERRRENAAGQRDLPLIKSDRSVFLSGAHGQPLTQCHHGNRRGDHQRESRPEPPEIPISTANKTKPPINRAVACFNADSHIGT